MPQTPRLILHVYLFNTIAMQPQCQPYNKVLGLWWVAVVYGPPPPLHLCIYLIDQIQFAALSPTHHRLIKTCVNVCPKEMSLSREAGCCMITYRARFPADLDVRQLGVMVSRAFCPAALGFVVCVSPHVASVGAW